MKRQGRNRKEKLKQDEVIVYMYKPHGCETKAGTYMPHGTQLEKQKRYYYFFYGKNKIR